jgi:hypothetical protein
MKRRITTVLNFLALNLLFFALYLNFVHKDKDVLESLHSSRSVHNKTRLVENEGDALQTTSVKESKTGVTKEIAKATIN